MESTVSVLKGLFLYRLDFLHSPIGIYQKHFKKTLHELQPKQISLY